MVRYHRRVGVWARQWGKKRGALVFGYLAFLSTTRPIVLFSCSLSLFCCLLSSTKSSCWRLYVIVVAAVPFQYSSSFRYKTTMMPRMMNCANTSWCMLHGICNRPQQSISIITHHANAIIDYSLVSASSVSSFVWMWYVAGGQEQEEMKWHPSSWRGATKHEDDSEYFLKQARLLLALVEMIKEDYHHL